MPLGINYMGTKKALAADVVALVDRSRCGPFLDAFSGMCAVGSRIGHKRQIWNNDLQIFAASVSEMYFCSSQFPPMADDVANQLFSSYENNKAALRDFFRAELALEDQAIGHRSAELLIEGATQLRTLENQVHGDKPSSRFSHRFPFDLFSCRYSGTYFGLAQCIEIDSIRFALDHARRCHKLTDEHHQWLVIALGLALSRCTTATGHFAQPLSPKPTNINRFAAQRARIVWHEWLSAIRTLHPIGTRDWRLRNRSFRSEANSLLKSLDDSAAPAVIYADPPYTKDQYSRYYHLYETLILYDYPEAIGTGQYRRDRATSPFSARKMVEEAFTQLIENAANLRSDLIISYPKNGLLDRSIQSIPDQMSRFFRRVDKPIEIEHVHSTMGSSKGEAKSAVTEVLYRGMAW